AVNVSAGTLKAGDGNFSMLLDTATSPTTIASAATIDLAGFSTTIAVLTGSGRGTNSGAAATPTPQHTGPVGVFGDFAGTITGPLSLIVAGLVDLSAANTYTGSTTIGSGDVLALGSGGTTGSIANTSLVIDNGTLEMDRSNAVTLANPISGA